MRLKTQLIVALGASCVFILGGVSFLIFQNKKNMAERVEREERNKWDLALAEEALQRSKALEALELAERHEREIAEMTPYGQKWLKVSINAGSKIQDGQFLLALYGLYPEAFKDNETASLEVAHALLEKQDYNSFTALKETWKAKAQFSDLWTLLEADALSLSGMPAEAITLLKTQPMETPLEQRRLLRMALLSLNEHPKMAWDYLTQAYKIDPSNADMRLYRAHLLSAIKKEDLAKDELTRLVENAPGNPLFKEELAAYYLRVNDYASARELLEKSLAANSSDELWLKALFISKVMKPISFQWKAHPSPKGELAPLVNYLTSLQEGQYWSELSPDLHLLEHREEALWFRVIAALKAGEEEKAYALLKEIGDPAPLKKSLLLVLDLRKNPVNLPEMHFTENELKSVHPFLRQLANPPYDAELSALISHPELFSAVFLANGWTEAALQLHQATHIPKELPAWVAYCLTQAMLQNRNLETALAFAQKHKWSPQLALLSAELFLKSNQPEQAISLLKRLNGSQTLISQKAGALLAAEHLRQGHFALARETIASNQRLVSSLEGLKMLASINGTVGDRVGMEAIFALIQDHSAEAKSYLASKAYQEKNYKLAYHLTAELYRQNPQNAELKENLKKIAREAKL